ncbi:MAG: cell wall hydrolase [Hespellia sp.]|nr:cell wall hydrolase [Hespellia sp.]
MMKNIRAALVATFVTICLLITTGFSVNVTTGRSELPFVDKIGTTWSEVEKSMEWALLSDTVTEITKENFRSTIEAERKKQETAKLAAEETARREAEAQAIQERHQQDQELLAALIFCEAGNQPYEGQVAVGAVVLNRVNSGTYPNSIPEVIYQPGQFGPARTGWLDSVLANGGYTDTAMQAAGDALAGVNPIGDCLYFGCGDYGILIGDHYFH